jgi:hypothetical protein
LNHIIWISICYFTAKKRNIVFPSGKTGVFYLQYSFGGFYISNLINWLRMGILLAAMEIAALATVSDTPLIS